MAVVNALSTVNDAISILSGTGTIDIGSDATAKQINIGSNSMTAGNLQLRSGSAGCQIATVNGPVSILSGTGSISIGTDAAQHALIIGNTTGNTSVLVACGSGGINIGTTSANRVVRIGRDAADGSSVSLQCGSAGGIIFIGDTSTSQNILIGNNTAGTAVELRATSGNINIGDTNTGGINISSGTSATTVNIASGAAAKTLTLGSTTTTSTTTLRAGSGGITMASGDIAATSGPLMINAAGKATNGGTTTFASGTGQLTVNTNHIVNNGTLCTLTMPAAAEVGQFIYIMGLGAGGWSIALSGGISINQGPTSYTTSVSSAAQYNTVYLICVVANTSWSVMSQSGSLAYV